MKIFVYLRKSTRMVVSLAIIFFFLFSTITPILTNHCLSAEPQSKSELTSHKPIHINNNNFTTANGVIEGNGTENNPYIIENWCIDADTADGIKIENTDKHLIIRNCATYNGYNPINSTYHYGINFYNVTNGKISNCDVYNNNYGINLQESSNNNVTMNQIYNNDKGGILLQFSSNNNNIFSNRIHNNGGSGITGSSSNSNIISNQIYNNDNYGVGLYYSSNNNITSNQIYNNLWDGISLHVCSNNNVTLNQIYNNHMEGICLYSSPNNQITNNNIYNNNYGISFEYSTSNEVHYNNIYNNTKYGFYNYQTYGANATRNWWGSSDGPSGVGPGSGDSISSGVIYNPWLPNKWGGVESHINPITPFWYNTDSLLINITASATEPVIPQGEIKNITLYYRYKTENSANWATWMEYEVDINEPWTWQFNTTQIQTKDCLYEFYSIATDTNLNIEPPPLTADAACGVDITPPTTTDSIPIDWQNNVFFTLNATDSFSSINQTYYKLWKNNTIEPSNWTANRTFTITEDGVWALKYHSTDNAGNTGSIINKTIKTDTQPPNTTTTLTPITPDGDNSYYITPVTIQLNLSDTHSGVNSTFYRINNDEWHKLTTTQSFTISQDGNYQIEYYSTDHANNIENIQILSFKIDVTTPQISITNITADTETKTIMVTWTTTSTDIESYTVKIDDTDWVNVGITNPYTNSYTFTNIGSGGHIVYVKATDYAGHSTTKNQTITDNMGETNENNGNGGNGEEKNILWIVLIAILITIIIAAVIIFIMMKRKTIRKKRIEKQGGGEK